MGGGAEGRELLALRAAGGRTPRGGAPRPHAAHQEQWVVPSLAYHASASPDPQRQGLAQGKSLVMFGSDWATAGWFPCLQSG